MKRERVRELKRVIKGLDEKRIDLDTYGCEGGWRSCVTPACVAGWAVYLFATPAQKREITLSLRPNGGYIDIHTVAKELLGLTYAQANKAFASYRTWDCFDEVDHKKQALQRLNNLLGKKG